VKKKLMPKGAIQSRTDFGANGYGGPCPPPGDKPHRYQITVFAVDVDKLPNTKNDAASAALVGLDLNSHTLAKATLTGLYGR
jgi:Raf kinase inhibitor-like YbhB/YbcL family protein